MYFYNFNVGDYRSHTAHLSITEHYIYRSLIDWYYLNERPMPANDLDYIAKVLLLKTEEEKQALQSILAEFFKVKKLKQTGDTVECYHHARIDTEIKNYQRGNGGRVYDHTGEVTQGNNSGNVSKNGGNVSGNTFGNVGNVSGNAIGNDFRNKGNVTTPQKGNVLTQAQRTAKSKAERKKLSQELLEIGATFDSNADIKALREIHARFFGNNLSVMGNDMTLGNGNDFENGGNVSGNTFGNVGNVSGNDGNFESNAFPHAINNNQEPITINQEPNIYTPVQNFETLETFKKMEKPVDNSQQQPNQNLYPIFDPDIDTLNSWFLRAGVKPIEDNAEYRQELTKFNLHFSGHTRLENNGFWFGKMITWFKNVQNRKQSEPASHAPVIADKPKLDPKTSVMLNGILKPCLPNMTQDETYEYLKTHKMGGEMTDETYNRVAKELEVMA